MLIVHDSQPVIPYFSVSVNEWLHARGDVIRADLPFAGGAGNNYVTDFSAPTVDSLRYSFANQLDSLLPFYSILVNGKGREKDSVDPWPLEVFVVNQGDRYRFRVAHTGVESSLRISVDQHTLIIVGSDAGDIEPITVESFWIFVSETIDFEIIADQPVENYWVRIETIGTQRDPDTDPDGIVNEGRAILRYSTSANTADPTSEPLDCTENSPCDVFNCPFEFYPQGYNRSCTYMADARSVEQQDILDLEFGLQETPDEEIFLNFNDIDVFDDTINSKAFTSPRAPLFMNVPNQITPCDQVDCTDGCYCTQILELPKNKVVQLVMTNYIPTFTGGLGPHVAHMHGHTFAVLKQGFGPLDPVTGRPVADNSDVSCTNSRCFGTEWAGGRPQMNLQKPPLKNTIILPTQGYVVVRFRTNNSGYWRLHCHIQPHVQQMALLVKVGDAPDAPKDFPQCENFDFKNDDDFQRYLEKNAKEAKTPKEKSSKGKEKSKDKKDN